MTLSYSTMHRRRWAWVSLLIGTLTMLLPTATVQAETVVFLPYIGQNSRPAAPEEFTIEWVRLWSVWENGGESQPLRCGNGPILQVDVFDRDGEGSRQPGTVNGRLNGITVEVTHTAADNSKTVVTKATGSGDFDDGVALFFTLASPEILTTIQIRTEVNGKLVSSPPVVVTTNSAAIPLHALNTAGYCSDESHCRALVDSGQCNGTFSWGVVFKRTY